MTRWWCCVRRMCDADALSKYPEGIVKEPCVAHVIRHMSHVTRHTSHVSRHTSHVTRHTSHVTRHTSHVTRHTSHVTRHTSHVTRHTSHVTRHTPHVTRHTPHVTRHTQQVTKSKHWSAVRLAPGSDPSSELVRACAYERFRPAPSGGVFYKGFTVLNVAGGV